MNEVQINTDDLVLMIGKKQVEIEFLQRQVAELKRQVDELKKPAPAKK